VARRTEQETEKTRKRIRVAAALVFAAAGYKGGSLAVIAKRARVPKSLVLHHFGSKQELWELVHYSTFQRYFDAQLATFSAPAPARQFVSKSCAAYFGFLQNNPTFLRMMYWNQVESSASTGRRHQRKTRAAANHLIAGGAERLRALQEQGEIRRDLDPQMLVACFLGLLRQWFSVREAYFSGSKQKGAAADAKYLRTVVALLTTGVQTPLPEPSSVD